MPGGHLERHGGQGNALPIQSVSRYLPRAPSGTLFARMPTMTSRILVATLVSCLSFVPASHAEDDTAGKEANPASDTDAEPTTEVACDLKQADRWSKASQAEVDLDPAKHTDRCPELANYAAATLSVKSSKELPQPCSAFASLKQGRQQVARYNWAYGSAMELLQEKGKADRVKRIGKALVLYNAQFAKYEGKIQEFSDLCLRVHSPELQASANDVSTWAQSGRLMRKSVETRRAAVWDKGGIKSSLDGSFKSVVKVLK